VKERSGIFRTQPMIAHMPAVGIEQWRFQPD